jgi:hypothetical protein
MPGMIPETKLVNTPAGSSLLKFNEAKVLSIKVHWDLRPFENRLITNKMTKKITYPQFVG